MEVSSFPNGEADRETGPNNDGPAPQEKNP